MNETSYEWDSSFTIEEPTNTYNLMPAGTTVDFTVEKITKKRNTKWNCPMMEISLKCTNPEYGETWVWENISLHSKAQYFINAFFSAIGLAGENKTFGELVNIAIGRSGKAKLKVESWQSNKIDSNGKPIIYESNKIDKYLKREESAVSATTTNDDEDIF